METIKAVLVFDLDDTLYYRRDPYLKTYREVFPEGCVEDESLLYKTGRKWSEITFRDHKAGKLTTEEMYLGRVIETFAEMGVTVSGEKARLFHERYVYHQEHITLVEGMEEVLSYLATQDVFLGLLSNGPQAHQRDKYRALGIDKYIPEDHVLVSGDIGFHKPDRKIFTAYEELLNNRIGNVSGDRIYMIGDSMETDMAGAKAAGWKTIYCKNPDLEEAFVVVPDYTANNAKELLQIFKEHIC